MRSKRGPHPLEFIGIEFVVRPDRFPDADRSHDQHRGRTTGYGYRPSCARFVQPQLRHGLSRSGSPHC
ncbi:hypothetical protein C487_15980 [Natrinema pallidum DSM 3751]|uniref:Uncharacterized protein n=2 Tax=Natrinema pallidum TaxID=69527 RepID=L9YJ91_9EURY|nr:hypothetical protein C487_15980 [Natrinema pallidum DSM 3751]QCW04988.1 hypothetical protein FGF80_11025 [Natrinema pallidum]